MLSILSKKVFYPLWELKDGSSRLKYLSALMKSQWLSRQELEEHQWQKLRIIVKYAYENCPYYKNLWKQKDISADIQTRNDFQKLPIVTKKDIRENTDAFISQEYSKQNLVRAKTGGSTGKALELYFDTTCQEIRNSAAMRADRWAGWDLGIKRAAVWGSPPKSNTLKTYIRNMLLDRYIFIDTINMNKETIEEFVQKWRVHKPKMIYGHAHSIYVLAQYLDEYNIKDIRPNGIIATSMMLLTPERELIEKVFQCSVTDRYGCEEVGLIACECEKHNGMHINSDHILLEILDDNGAPVEPGTMGNIVVTDLVNKGMPLIRYKVEDIGLVSDRVCECGRGQPILEKVVGRVADFLIRADRSKIAGVSLVEKTLTAIPGLDQMQIIQEEINEFIVNIVKGPKFSESSELLLQNELKKWLGEGANIKVNNIEKILPEKSGKYRFSICKVREQ